LNDVTRNQLREIALAADRATSLTRQLLMFSRKQVIQTQVLDLNATTQGVAKMIARLLGEHITLKTTYSEVRLSLEADAGMVEQVLMNLAVNARDAMPNGGTLFIETALVELPTSGTVRHPEARPGKFISLSVRDSGCGMDTATLQRIFEPFFTTKSPGKGTGLGLATVYGIVKQSGGHIFAYSEPGKGTAFKIYFPPVAGSVAADTPAPDEEAPRGSETILLVEDEEALREITREILEAAGYTVLEAAHGAAALHLSERHQGKISLLITDVVMPGLTGSELAVRLTAERADMKVLFMSGYTDDAVVLRGVLTKQMPFVQKPFTILQLARRVRAVLDAG
jgi:CheY-like chemotaxis protein